MNESHKLKRNVANTNYTVSNYFWPMFVSTSKFMIMRCCTRLVNNWHQLSEVVCCSLFCNKATSSLPCGINIPTKAAAELPELCVCCLQE